MTSDDAAATPSNSPPPNTESIPPIGVGSVETSELDCEIIGESILPKVSAGPPHTGGFPQRILPPPFPSPLPPKYDAKPLKSPHRHEFSGAQSNYPFVYHHEKPWRASGASSGKQALPIDRPHKRKRCNGLTKSDKLALITICTRHKADYKQGDKTGFWDLVKNTMAAQTGKELAQPRSMVERWCNWEIDQVLDRQTTNDQQDFRDAVKDFCAKWKEVRQEYLNRKQSKGIAADDSVRTWADTPVRDSRSNLQGNDVRPKDIKHVLCNVALDKTAEKNHSLDHGFDGKILKSHSSPSNADSRTLPSIFAAATSASSKNAPDRRAFKGSMLNDSPFSCTQSVSSPHNSGPPFPSAASRELPDGNTSTRTITHDGQLYKGDTPLEPLATGNSFAYISPYRRAQYRGPTAGNETTSVTPSGDALNGRTEGPITFLPTPRASISGSQSSTSSPITNVDLRQFPKLPIESKRNPGPITPQSLSRVTSAAIDDLAQAYVSRTYEASFDILREIMSKHDEVVRQISASRALVEKDLEVSKRRLASVEYELEITRRERKEEKAALAAQFQKSELQDPTTQQIASSSELQKTEAALTIKESHVGSQQPHIHRESPERQFDDSKHPSVQMEDEIETFQPQVKSSLQRAKMEKELEACQRQIVRIKNEKSVLELELSVSKRQIQELKGLKPDSQEMRTISRSSHDGTVAKLPKMT